MSRTERTYRYALLDPRRAGADNESVLRAGPVLGIEVTVPALAARCDLGNLDPQHTGGDSSRAAIEEALEVPLPPPGAILVTIRPDLDSLGSMAVLELRAKGRPSDEVVERAQTIAQSDAWQRGPWPGPQPPPDPSQEPEVTALEPIAAIVMAADVPLEERVESISTWLLTGTCPGYEEAADRVRCEKEDALGATAIELAGQGRIAIVRSTHRLGVAMGYRRAPVVVVENPSFSFSGGEPHRKITICQYEEGWMALDQAVAELSAREPGWGGSPTICGSPQGEPCELPLEEIIGVVERHLLR